MIGKEAAVTRISQKGRMYGHCRGLDDTKGYLGKESTCQCWRCKKRRFPSQGWDGKFHGHKNRVGCSLCGYKESEDTTECLGTQELRKSAKSGLSGAFSLFLAHPFGQGQSQDCKAFTYEFQVFTLIVC